MTNSDNYFCTSCNRAMTFPSMGAVVSHEHTYHDGAQTVWHENDVQPSWDRYNR